MANFTAARLNTTYPPGDVTYPDSYDEFVNLNELVANEVEYAREGENSLADNLQNNYLKSTLLSNIVGNGFKFTGMPNGTSGPTSKDYATVSQVTALSPGIPDVDELDTDIFNIPHSQFIVVDSSNFGVFDYVPDTLTDAGSYFYPAALNKTYYLDWSTVSETLVDLDNPFSVVPPPVNGDRLRFIFANPGYVGPGDDTLNDGIQAATNKIQSLGEKVTFGEAMDHAVYELVYVGLPTGWLFKNVILGA